MKQRTACSLALLVASILLAGAVTAAPEVRIRDDNALWDKGMALDLKDAEVRQVLMLVFQVAEEHVLIDPCVQGKVTLKFENVSLRDALTSIARMGDYRVRPRREGYYVGCAEPEGGATATAEDAQLIQFRLTSFGDGSVITEPRLFVAYDSLAEINVGSLPVDDLDDTGDFFAGDLRPRLRIKVYLDRDEDGIATDRLRGVVELAVRDVTGALPTLRMAAQSFELDLPAGTLDTSIVTLDVAGETYELTASRPAP